MNAYLVLSKNQFSQFLFLVMLFHRSITIKPCQDADLKAFLVNSFDLSSALHIIKYIALLKKDYEKT